MNVAIQNNIFDIRFVRHLFFGVDIDLFVKRDVL